MTGVTGVRAENTPAGRCMGKSGFATLHNFLSSYSVCILQLREKAAGAKKDAGGLAPLAHGVLEAQNDEQAKAAELAALKR